MPTPPEWLTDYAKDEWYTQTAELEALRILSTMDLSMLAMYCQQVGIFRQAQEEMKREGNELVVTTPNGALQPNPLLGIANKAADLALKIAGQFGFTPSARTRIGTPVKEEEDPLAELLNRRS
ncbi:phage terminase small subunit P27 family [Spirosoma sp. BT702]|uniref:Phage terminase small subunit P27 family n=1 Tax=Spirosoma profusum TaxID=2771354 RepID=A0A926Y039_9BACT|nr:phage terminase small subunit P27 family [Spirosoma profusum]MBD2704179.1 phage terminase small subunit P27 family [Spirosoma profusum]